MDTSLRRALGRTRPRCGFACPPRRIAGAFLVCASLTLAPAVAASDGSDALPAPAPADEYRIAVGDVVEIAVAGMPDMRQRLPVQLDGAISYPNLGRLVVAGTAIRAMQRTIQAALSSQVYRHRLADGREVTVTVEPREVSANVVEYRPVYVDGDIARPGEQPYRPLMTVRQAVSVAGGYDLLRFGTKPPLGELADARGEFESVTAELAKEQSNIARLRRELGDKEGAPRPTADPALPRQVLADLQKSQADLFDVDQIDAMRERSFLRRGVEQLGAQSEVLTRQQRDEQQGVKVDTEELDRLTELLGKGAVISQRVTEARRALLLSSTRSLQTTAQLMQATRQREEIGRQLERLDDLRRSKLLAELSERTIKAQQLQARLGALNLKVSGLAARPLDESGTRRVPALHIIRRTSEGHVRLPAEEETQLSPGDVVEVALKAPMSLSATR